MNQFESELRNSIALRAVGDRAFQLEAFASELASRLEEGEVVFDITIEPLRCTGRNRKGLELLGYADDSADDSLVVLVGQYFDESGAVLTMTDAKRIFTAGAAFLEQSADGWLLENLEISSKEAEHAHYFARRLEAVGRIKFILLTDGVMSDRIKSIPSDEVCGKPASYAIWDIKRFESLAEAESGLDDVVVDLTRWLPEGLPCLVGAESGDHAKSYLAVLPGRLLAEVFREHGSQLLESNVRTYLSARGKVNKGIQYSLAHEPEMFLAYNNGLTTTATGIDIAETGGMTTIRSIENWQIVNGGQTTSSLVHFLRQGNGRSLDGVFVQMKLVTVDPNQAAELVSNISRFANSQNKVSEADFFSNSQFHVRLEQISQRLKAPAREGEQFQTRWFYERARGQFENTRSAKSAAEQKKFDLEYPKTQRLTKTDWAKFAFSWAQKPHEVSKGAQSNFMAFADVADRVWRENPDSVNDSYFRDGIAKAIMYNSLRPAILKASWYGTGYLANIVTYTMSKFAFEIGRQFEGAKLDFDAVWNRQSLSQTSLDQLLEIAEVVQGVLTDPGRPQSNVTQWAKQPACWEAVKKARITLSAALESDLVSSSAHSEQQVDARKQRRMDTGFEVVSRMLNVRREIWDTVVRDGTRAGFVSPTDRSIIEKVTGGGTVPSDRQAARMLQVLERSAENALISREDF